MDNARRLLGVASIIVLALLVSGAAVFAAGCGSSEAEDASGTLKVTATTSFLRDIAQNVAGDQFSVGQLIPAGVEPHEWQSAPADLEEVATSDLAIVNGGGLEGTLVEDVESAGGEAQVVVASQGLASRTPQPGEPGEDEAAAEDPHWWLDPIAVQTYVENIRDAFAAADPDNAAAYQANAAAYVAELDDLDAWIRTQVESIPATDRVLIMNHLSHGYYADRYGLRVAGAVIPSVSSGETVSAKQLAALVHTIDEQHVKAIFVEIEENPDLAQQIAAEADVKVVTDLLDHSLTDADGPAPTYLEMMRYDTRVIVAGLQ